MPPFDREKMRALLLAAPEKYSAQEIEDALNTLEAESKASATTDEAEPAEETAPGAEAAEARPKKKGYTPTERFKAGLHNVTGSDDPGLKNVLHSGLNSALMGFLPQLRGLGADIVPGGKNYSEGVEAERQSLSGIPASQRITGEVMGAMIPGGALAKSGQRGAQLARSAVKLGGLEGAVRGAADSEGNLIDRVWDTAKGGAIGAGTGYVGSKILDKALPMAADVIRPEGTGRMGPSSRSFFSKFLPRGAGNQGVEISPLLSGEERAAQRMQKLLGASGVEDVRNAGYRPIFPGDRLPKATDVDVGGKEFARKAEFAADKPRDYGEALDYRNPGMLRKSTRVVTEIPSGSRNIAAGTRKLSEVEGARLVRLANYLESVGKRADAETLRRQIVAAGYGAAASGETSRKVND